MMIEGTTHGCRIALFSRIITRRRTHNRNANVAVADGVARPLFHRGENTEARAGDGAFRHVQAALFDIIVVGRGRCACSIVVSLRTAAAAAGLRFLRRRCGGGETNSRQWQQQY